MSAVSRLTRERIIAATDEIWMVEPPDLARIRWGIMDNGETSDGQTFPVLVHLEAYTMILAHEVIYRLMRIVHEENLNLDLAIRLTRQFLRGDFAPGAQRNHTDHGPDFFADLGLNELAKLGRAYLAALDGLDDTSDYISLTGALLTYLSRTHRWIHLMFPWNLGVAFPHTDRSELAGAAALPRDSPATG